MRTRAPHRHTQNHTQMPHRRSASPPRPLSLCCCQTKAWKAGHKGECVAAACRADTRTAAKPTADQMRVLKMLEQLAGAADWRGVAAQERAARAVAAAVRTSMPSIASFVYRTLGRGLLHPRQRVSVAGGLQPSHRVPHAVPGDCKGGGRPGGGGRGVREPRHLPHALERVRKAVDYYKAQHVLAISLKLAHMQSDAALNMGVALTLRVRSAVQGHVAGADQAPGPHSRSLALACLDDRVREAAKWLQAAFDGGRPFAKLHLAHLTFFAGQEDAALAHLKEHLSWRVQRGRDTCAGCGQTRGEDTPMLTCSGCRVARFCSADHQKMASKKAALGGSLTTGRHKDICGVLRKWREAVKDGVAPDSCTAELVAFLQRENARCPKDAEGAPEAVLS
mgnify:CR=1 FL=1